MPALLAAPLLLASAFALQPTGEFHAGEAVARDGETWLALRIDAPAAALTTVTVRAEPWHDVVLDEENEKSGVRISVVEPGAAPLVLLRGDGLSAGAVEQAQTQRDIDAAGSPSLLPHYRILFRDQQYRIHTACSQIGASAAVPAKLICNIVLHTPQGAQTLARMPASSTDGTWQLGDDAAPELLFAGDLDRDGRLDLLFNLTDHYNLSRTVLLLSSAARGGDAVAEVARFESVGC